jgi:serine protease DegS
MGIVSATGRGQLGVTTFEDFIQTDAAINVGNSGGALINARGELVGINTAVISMAADQTMPEGLGFAIPVNLVRGVIEQLLMHGRVIRGYLGVDEPRDLPASQAKILGIDGSAVLITGASGPAAAAGLRGGDVLTHIDGQRMFTRQQAMNFVASAQPGDRIRIRVVRADRQPFETEAVLEERPPPDRG